MIKHTEKFTASLQVMFLSDCWNVEVKFNCLIQEIADILTRLTLTIENFPMHYLVAFSSHCISQTRAKDLFAVHNVGVTRVSCG